MSRLLTTDQMTDAQRKRGMQALIVATFFSWGGFFMVIPLVAVHFVDHLGWAAATVGLILAVRQFSQQVLTMVFGILSDRIGPRWLITIGQFIRALGFFAMGFADDFSTLMIASLIIGLGGAMFEAPKSAAIAALTYPEERRRFYSSIGVMSGVGTAVGTQIGAILIAYDFRQVCFGAGAAYLVVAAILLVMIPSVASSVGDISTSSGIRLVLADRVFLRYVMILSGYLFASTQFGLTMTLAAVEITATDRAVSWIYLVNSVITIALGYTLPRALEQWFSTLVMQIVGIVLVGLGLMAMGVSGGFVGVMTAAGVFAIGTVLTRPGQETILANLANPGARGTYFGIAASALAIGGSLGSYMGGVIYDSGGGATSPLPWAIFGGVALISAFLMWINRAPFSIVRS